MSLRSLPSVDTLARAAQARGSSVPHELLVGVARSTLEQARTLVRAGAVAPELEMLAAQVLARIDQIMQPTLRPAINATGVLLQTNLGRAPLSAAALRAMQEVGAGYSNLEYDLTAGERGSRYDHLAGLLAQLTGAETGLALNNNAGALYLALVALAQGREVLVSRGQAVEIGGGFRIPDVLRQSGATLVEVGTTNRTYAQDYERAIGEHSAMILRVHNSNFRVVGFVHEPSLAELADVARRHELVLLDDLGSGSLLDTRPYGLQPEPTVQQSIAAGSDLVTFSGDKLLGGPQAGLLVGRELLLAQLRRHPLARALRVDKTTIAGLEATLGSYLRGRAVEELPLWRMIAAPLDQLRDRAERIAGPLWEVGVDLQVVESESAVGGGSLPGVSLPSAALALKQPGVEELHAHLRNGRPAVVGRIADGQLLLDLRSVLPHQDAELLRALQAALRPGA